MNWLLDISFTQNDLSDALTIQNGSTAELQTHPPSMSVKPFCIFAHDVHVDVLTFWADHSDDDGGGGGWALQQHRRQNADCQVSNGVTQDFILPERFTRLFACKSNQVRTDYAIAMDKRDVWPLISCCSGAASVRPGHSQGVSTEGKMHRVHKKFDHFSSRRMRKQKWFAIF